MCGGRKKTHFPLRYFSLDFLDSLCQCYLKGKPSSDFLIEEDIFWSLTTFVSAVSGTILLYQEVKKSREWEVTLSQLPIYPHLKLIHGCHTENLLS